MASEVIIRRCSLCAVDGCMCEGGWFLSLPFKTALGRPPPAPWLFHVAEPRALASRVSDSVEVAPVVGFCCECVCTQVFLASLFRQLLTYRKAWKS